MLKLARDHFAMLPLLVTLGGCHLIFPFAVDPAPSALDGAVSDAAVDASVSDAAVDEAVSDAAADEAVSDAAIDASVSDAAVDQAGKDLLPPVPDTGPPGPPTVSWAQAFGGPGTDKSLDVLAHGNKVLITGSFQSTLTFYGTVLSTGAYNTDLFLASFDGAAKLLSAKQYGGASYDEGVALAPGTAGNTVATGYFKSPSLSVGGTNLTNKGGTDVFLAAHGAGLTHAWSKGHGGVDFDYFQGVASDKQGNIYVVGQFAQEIDLGGGKMTSKGYSDLLVASFTATGSHRWSKSYGTATSYERGLGVAVDDAGRVLITGSYGASMSFGGPVLPAKRVFIASYQSKDGAYNWAKGFGDQSNSRGVAVAADAAANVYFTGTLVGKVNFGGGSYLSHGTNDLFIASFTATGAHRWSKLLGAYSADEGQDVAVDSAGNVYITGSFSAAPIELGGGPRPNQGYQDILVASYTPLGAHRWSMSFGGGNPDSGHGVAVDGSGAVYLTGTFQSTVIFGSFMRTSKGGFDLFLLKLTP